MSRSEKIDALMQAFFKLKRTMHKQLSEPGDYDLTPAQMEILALIKAGSTRISDIAQAIQASMSAATQHVNQLVESGLATKVESSLDRREVVLHLTNRGVAAIEKKHRLMRHRLEQIVDTLSDEELDQFINISQKIANHKE